MSKQELLNEYKKSVNSLRIRGKTVTGLSYEQINKVFQKHCNIQNETSGSIIYNKIKSNESRAQNILHATKRTFLIITLCLVFIYVLLNVHQTSSSIVLRNVQGFTYSTLRIIRILSVPIIRIFPSVTGLYDESCLIENPNFRVVEMECWPCENVHSVIDLTGTVDHGAFRKTGSGTPFITKVNQPVITLDNLREFYRNNYQLLDRDSSKIKSTECNIKSLKDLFDNRVNSSCSNLHIQWRINKMSLAILARKLFPRPFFISERSGQSVERYVMIDELKAKPYAVPNMECHYVFIVQASGERTIV